MKYGRQQLLWQRQVIVIGSINLVSQIDEYHTTLDQFQRAICSHGVERRQHLAPTSLFFVALDA